jgi:hypothetical protein
VEMEEGGDQEIVTLEPHLPRNLNTISGMISANVNGVCDFAGDRVRMSHMDVWASH